MVAADVLKLVPLRTHLMVADALTKSFAVSRMMIPLFLSLPAETEGTSSVVTGGASPPREFMKVPPSYFQIVVGKGESDKGDFVG
jgi:hypothetical protein